MKSSGIRSFCAAASFLLGASILAAPASSLSAQGHQGHKVEKKVDKKVEKAVDRRNDRITARKRATAKGTRARTSSTYRTRILCADGTWSSRGRAGCANHDGVAVRQVVVSKGSVPRASDRARARASSRSAVARRSVYNNDPTGARARCNDGTYAHTTYRSGTCANHGGVAVWY